MCGWRRPGIRNFLEIVRTVQTFPGEIRRWFLRSYFSFLRSKITQHNKFNHENSIRHKHLHSNICKYNRLFKEIHTLNIDIIINGGDMRPKGDNIFKQDKFITKYLDKHFTRFNFASIFYLCCLGNDDLRTYHDPLDATCDNYAFVYNLAQREIEIGGYEFIGMNWVVDYPFRLNDFLLA